MAGILLLLYRLLKARKTPWDERALVRALTMLQNASTRVAVSYLTRSGFVPDPDSLHPGLSLKATASILRGPKNVETLLTTETMEHYTDVLRRAVPGEGSGAFEKVWNARAEACPVCASYHGTAVPMGQQFPWGVDPGFVHPNCACFLTYRKPPS